MSQVRVPRSGSVLLPFCRPWPERRDNACFESYAEMMVFAAGIGYSKTRQKRPPGCGDFLEQPYPIPLDIFKSLQLFPILLLLGLAVTGEHRIARDEKRISGVLEDYANLGFREMTTLLKNTTPEEMHVELARVLVDAPDLKV